MCFSGACAGEWRGDAHVTSPSELRSEGRRRNVCRHTPKAKPKQRRACREIPGVIRLSRTRCGKPRNFSRETADQRVADWRRERTHESGFRLEMRSIGKAFLSTCDQIERGSFLRDPSRRDRRRFFSITNKVNPLRRKSSYIDAPRYSARTWTKSTFSQRSSAPGAGRSGTVWTT